MEVILNKQQEHVDSMIEARIVRLSQDAWRKANFLPNGKQRKNYVPYTHPQEVHDLLALRQELYKGVDPETIAAQITSGEIQHKFLNS